MSCPGAVFVALVATHNRPSLLAKRALLSIAAQTRKPDFVVVADDSLPRFHARNRKAVESFSATSGIRASYVTNTRNKGVCGTWNTGTLSIMQALKHQDFNRVYLAILDDDDEWLPGHLAQVANTLHSSVEHGFDFMAVPFERRKEERRFVITPPQKLIKNDFLIGNPGIVSSALVIRMSVFLRAGMFDESLSACTDRDLCIRLSILPDVLYKPLDTVSVIHWAEENRLRLSSAGSPARLAGLSGFIGKYRGWMDSGEYSDFCKRAYSLFGWTEKPAAKPSHSTRRRQRFVPPPPPESSEKIALVIGIIVDPVRSNHALFADILRLSKDARLSAVDVVVMPSSGDGRAVRNAMEQWRRAGLRIYCIDSKQFAGFSPDFIHREDIPTMRPIAMNRTILQHAVAHLATFYRHPVCWILDGDNRLHGLKMADGKTAEHTPDYIGEMQRLRATHCDVAIGEINGAAPLPRALTVRTQMLDLLHLLSRLQLSEHDQYAPTVNIANIEQCDISENYYHDCHAHSHLEQPVGVPPQNYSPQALIQNLPALLNRILAGAAVTRPLLSPGVMPSHLHRGGNTLIFNPDVLRECPNTLFRAGRSNIRREDEIWRIMSACAFNCRILSGYFPVTQSRENDAPQAPDIEKVAADISGHAMTSALRTVIRDRRFSSAQETITFLLEQNLDFPGEVRRASEDRLTAIRGSFFRICGIAQSMHKIVKALDCGEAGQKAAAALGNIACYFAPEKWCVLEEKVSANLTPQLMHQRLSDYPALCRAYAELQYEWTDWIKQERRKNAVHLLSSRVTKGKRFRFLGQGGEGAVFTDREQLHKVLHRWYARKDITDADFLQSLVGQWKQDEPLYPVLGAEKDGGDLILTMPFEKSMPYGGGDGAGLTQLLASMKQQGVVSWNITPKNLRCVGDTVRMIDYGVDLHPFIEKDFDLAIRKAWLCWRWAFREDLHALGTQSLTSSNMPELDGYQNMKAAIEQYGVHSRPDDSIMERVLQCAPGSVLDYGCGKSGKAIKIAAHGIQVDAFDPHLTKKNATALKSANIGVIGNIGNVEKQYDVIIFRHVLCEVASDKDLRECLYQIRRLIAPDGQVIVSACASGNVVPNTACAHQEIPRSANYEQKFHYRKLIRATGNYRDHVHRPESMLQRELARSGFDIASRFVCSCMDLDRFESIDGSINWILNPLPQHPQTALVIRACAMDAEHIEFQVRHLVRQLNYPRGFSEIILAIDGKTSHFLRPHVDGDLPSVLASARRLKREGWIDRIVVAPVREREIARITKKYLDLQGVFTHALNGAPLLPTLCAFDSCHCEYALHIDVDMIVGRIDGRWDYLGEMLNAMSTDSALTMALNIPGSISRVKDNKQLPFRLEVRSGLTNIGQLKKMLPLPVETGPEGIPTKGWHRMVDQLISLQRMSSLRGGNQKLFVFHPPNRFKNCEEAMDIVINGAEKGFFPESQRGKNEWNGESAGWLFSPRREQFIFVICGGNVPHGRIDRCLNSVIRQDFGNWGVVLMDDASSDSHGARLKQWAEKYSQHMTYFARRKYSDGLANLHFAVRQLCTDPESIIVTLDMDDALLGTKVLTRLHQEYQQGADMTVGSMLRTDKQATYPVCFDDPRNHRGGSVWQHLRSFRKRLFDAIPNRALRDCNGDYYSIAGDWAYMLPITEMAKHPVWIRDPLYLYEPDVRRKKRLRVTHKSAVAEIVRRPSLKIKK